MSFFGKMAYDKLPLLILPYQGKQGDTVMKSLKNTLKRCTQQNETFKVVYTGTKLGSCFNLKDKTKREHQQNVVYRASCPNENCQETYIGETQRRISERVKDHQGRDHNSNIHTHALGKSHETINMNNIEILSTAHRHNYNRKITEALLIKKLKPSLNTQEKSIPLKLFI